MTEKKKILIADDESIIRESLTDWLTEHGYQVVTAANGDETLKMLKKGDGLGVVVLDVRMPGKDGITILEEARKKYPALKYIIISGYPSVDVMTRGIRLGAIGFLVKPFDPEELEKLIHHAIDGEKGPAAVATATEDTSRTEEEILGQISGKEIASMMAENRVFRPSREFSEAAALRSLEEYKALYNWSIKDPEGFWGQVADQLDWYKKWDKFLEYDFKNKPEVRYFIGGKINVSYNCLDRHLNTWRKNKAAIIWQGEPDDDTRVYTYQQLHHEVCKFANVLKKLGVKKGDTVSIYLPMIPELAIAMLACVRIGAVHSVVFGGFSAEALRDRILDCRSKILITADGYYRSGRQIKSKESADAAAGFMP